jgi:hypothetical protein
MRPLDTISIEDSLRLPVYNGLRSPAFVLPLIDI